MNNRCAGLGSNALANKISGIVPLKGTFSQLVRQDPKEVWPAL